MSGTLQARLDRIKKSFLAKVPDEVEATMARATEELRASGIEADIPSAGDRLPPFELPDTDGNPVRSGDLLEAGPLVVTFYRGVW